MGGCQHTHLAVGIKCKPPVRWSCKPPPIKTTMKVQNRRNEHNPPLLVDDPRKRYKDHDLRICTWNVRTLYRPGVTIQLADVLENYKADITAIQEMRWTGHGCTKRKNCDIYYSCHEKRHEFGCGFVVGKRLRHLVSRFNPVSERIATIRIRAKYFNITLICAHAPTEDKDDEIKEMFYERLEETYDRCPGHDIKIVLGDFNAKVGRENVFHPTVGNFSLHDTTSDNGIRLVDFAAAKNMVVSSTRFRHKDIHKATWVSPDQRTRNQIDHLVIDGRHSSSVMDVRVIRGANIDSDHYLVAAKVRTRLSRAKNVRNQGQRKLDIGQLQLPEMRKAYADKLTQLLAQNTPPDDTEAQWKHISHSVENAAKTVLGYEKPPQDKPWYDEECRLANDEKNAARTLMLQSVATRAATERYKVKRREENRLFKRKKRQWKKRESEQIETYRQINEARKFYQKVNSRGRGNGSWPPFCKDKDGNLVTDTQSMLAICRDHFSTLLVAERKNLDETIGEIDDDGIDCHPPNQDEVRTAIARLKNNKAAGADGLPAELFKTGGDELIGSMHKLICKIWLDECMPDDWNLSVLCPVFKKGDPNVCGNYRGISLLPIAYKVLSSVMCERLKPIVADLIGPYQCGFRPGKSTTDQIFTLRQILEKTHEKQIDTYHLFVDYKAAFDSPIREKLYEAMSELGIPTKLIRLCRMTLNNTRSSVKVGKELTDPFDTRRGLRQGDTLSCDLFNIIMEVIMRKAAVNMNKTISSKSHMLLAYADDIDIIGRNMREVTAVFSRIERESAKFGLAVNEDKTKLMVSTGKPSTRLDQRVNVDNRYNFEVVDEFIYLGSAVNTNNNVSLEIKRRIVLANRCYFGLSKHFRDKALSRATKIQLYQTLIQPVLLYGSECWAMSQTDETALGVFERKILRKIYGPIIENGEYRRRWNHELYELYPDIDVVRRVKIDRLRWLGHVSRMDQNEPARKVFEDVLEGRRKVGRPRLRWKDQVDESLRILGVTNWREKAKDRAGWRNMLSSFCNAPSLTHRL